MLQIGGDWVTGSWLFLVSDEVEDRPTCSSNSWCGFIDQLHLKVALGGVVVPSYFLLDLFRTTVSPTFTFSCFFLFGI
ncbi:hypothetical protein L1887_09381 [Cichorium endivia]|nr:hypothetical protein L1887_09381 [Cichorium endivia]